MAMAASDMILLPLSIFLYMTALRGSGKRVLDRNAQSGHIVTSIAGA